MKPLFNHGETVRVRDDNGRVWDDEVVEGIHDWSGTPVVFLKHHRRYLASRVMKAFDCGFPQCRTNHQDYEDAEKCYYAHIRAGTVPRTHDDN